MVYEIVVSPGNEKDIFLEDSDIQKISDLDSYEGLNSYGK